jgi:hypothetical protein
MEPEFEKRFYDIMSDHKQAQNLPRFLNEYKKIITLCSGDISEYLGQDFEEANQRALKAKQKNLDKHLSKSLELIRDDSFRRHLNPNIKLTAIISDGEDFQLVERAVKEAISAIESIRNLNAAPIPKGRNGRPKGYIKEFVAYEIARNMLSILQERPTSSENGKLKELYCLCCDIAEQNYGDDNRHILKAVKAITSDYQ